MLKHGFDDIDRFGGMNQIEQHCMDLAKRLYLFLSNGKHDNGRPIAIVYGWNSKQIDIVNFNLLRDDGSFVGFVEVEKMCDLFNVELITGCHCNQGACSYYLGLDEQTQMKHKEVRVERWLNLSFRWEKYVMMKLT
jgi:molybdenum cofactor sulfurtransferase